MADDADVQAAKRQGLKLTFSSENLSLSNSSSSPKSASLASMGHQTQMGSPRHAVRESRTRLEIKAALYGGGLRWRSQERPTSTTHHLPHDPHAGPPRRKSLEQSHSGAWSRDQSPANRVRSLEQSPAHRIRSLEQSPAHRKQSLERLHGGSWSRDHSPATRVHSSEQSPAHRSSSEYSPEHSSQSTEGSSSPRLQSQEASPAHRMRSPARRPWLQEQTLLQRLQGQDLPTVLRSHSRDHSPSFRGFESQPRPPERRSHSPAPLEHTRSQPHPPVDYWQTMPPAPLEHLPAPAADQCQIIVPPSSLPFPQDRSGLGLRQPDHLHSHTAGRPRSLSQGQASLLHDSNCNQSPWCLVANGNLSTSTTTAVRDASHRSQASNQINNQNGNAGAGEVISPRGRPANRPCFLQAGCRIARDLSEVNLRCRSAERPCKLTIYCKPQDRPKYYHRARLRSLTGDLLSRSVERPMQTMSLPKDRLLDLNTRSTERPSQLAAIPPRRPEGLPKNQPSGGSSRQFDLQMLSRSTERPAGFKAVLSPTRRKRGQHCIPESDRLPFHTSTERTSRDTQLGPSRWRERLRSQSLENTGKLKISSERCYDFTADDLIDQGEIGRGAYGTVNKMYHEQSNTVMAVKRIRSTVDEKEQKQLLMDLDVVMRSNECPYIVQFYGALFKEGDCWICMEVMCVSLDKFYKFLYRLLNEHLEEDFIGKVTVATLKALSYLKDKLKIIHRDVKPSNILLDLQGHIKLCDFGISGQLVDSIAKTRDAGCRPYMAPERIDPRASSRGYDIRSDVWSLGITLVEISTGRFPYPKWNSVFDQLTQVVQGDPPFLKDTEDHRFSQEFINFVNCCLTKEQDSRPKYNKLLRHPFIRKYEETEVSIASYVIEIVNQMPPDINTLIDSLSS